MSLKEIAYSFTAVALVSALNVLLVRLIPKYASISPHAVAKAIGFIQLVVGLIGAAVVALMFLPKQHYFGEEIIFYPALFSAVAFLPNALASLGYAYWDSWWPVVFHWFTQPRKTMPGWAKIVLVGVAILLSLEMLARILVYVRYLAAETALHGGLSSSNWQSLSDWFAIYADTTYDCLGRIEVFGYVLAMLGFAAMFAGWKGGVYIFTASIVLYLIGYLQADYSRITQHVMTFTTYKNEYAITEGQLRIFWVGWVYFALTIRSFLLLGLGVGWLYQGR